MVLLYRNHQLIVLNLLPFILIGLLQYLYLLLYPYANINLLTLHVYYDKMKKLDKIIHINIFVNILCRYLLMHNYHFFSHFNRYICLNLHSLMYFLLKNNMLHLFYYSILMLKIFGRRNWAIIFIILMVVTVYYL